MQYKSHILFLVLLIFSKSALSNNINDSEKYYHLAECPDGTIEYVHSNKISLSNKEITSLRKIIFKNECAGKYKI